MSGSLNQSLGPDPTDLAFASDTEWVPLDDPLLEAARAAGLTVLTDPATVLDPSAVQLVPEDLSCVGLGFVDGYLAVGWASLPSSPELETAQHRIGVPLQVVLCPPELHAELCRQAHDIRVAERPTLERILEAAAMAGASDIHLLVGSRPHVRVGGILTPLQQWPVLNTEDLENMAHYIAGDVAFRDDFAGEYDCALSYGGWRYRVSLHRQRDTLSVVMRTITSSVPGFDTLGLPAIIETFTEYKQGLVLVCGPTGSGKSTTLASLIDKINREHAYHIITIEDPVEYVHPSKRAIVRQREVGSDTHSFANALRSALRQDPDVILVGEMRDFETIETTLRAAETGHLVFSTLHSQTTQSTIDRVIDVFPANQQNQVRTQLADVLLAIVCQTLLPSMNEPGKRVVICEILIITPAVKNLIRENNTHQLSSVLQSGVQEHGMQSFDLALARAVAEHKISPEEATRWVRHPQTYRDYLNRFRTGEVSAFAADPLGSLPRRG